MTVLTAEEAKKALDGISSRPFQSNVLSAEEAKKALRSVPKSDNREPRTYTVSKPQEPKVYRRNADGLMTQVVTQPTVKQQKQAENAARLDALAGRTGAQKDPPAPIGRPQMQSYTSQREGVAMQLPQIDQWNANAAMPAVKELAGKAVNMGTNILFPLKGMKQGVDLLTGKTQSTFDPEAERQALSQMGAVQRGVERVAGGLNSIVETPAAALRYAGETAVQAGKNLAENFQKDGYGDRLSEAVYRKIKNQLTETAFDPVLLKYVSVPIGTPPGKVHEAYLKLQEEKGMEQAAFAALKEITTDTPVDPNSAGSQMMRQTQERQAAAVEGLSPTGQFIGNTLASVGQNAMLMPLAAINPAVPLAGMAGMAGAGKAYEVQQAGGGAMEALARGTVSGLIEAATEKLPLDNLLKIASSPVGKKAIWNILEQMGTEATEEAVSYVANYIADAAAKDPNAEFSLKDMMLSALGGGLSGGIMGAGGVVVGYARNGNVNSQAAQPAQESAFTRQAGTDANAAQSAAQADSAGDAVSSVSKGEAKATSAELIGKLRNSIPEISRMKPVAQITGNEFAKGQKSLVQQVGEFFRSLGNKVTRQGFGDVRLDERGVKDSMAHGIGRRKAAAFAAVPHVIQFGQEIDEQTNWKNRGYDTRVFAAPITVGGTETNYIAAVVTQGTDNRYYLHEVLDQDGNIIFSAKKEAGAVQTDLLPSSGSIGSPTSLDPTVPQTEPGVNTSIPNAGSENSKQPGLRSTNPDVQAMMDAQGRIRVSRRTQRVFDRLGEKLGVNIIVDAHGNGENGYYDSQTRTIHLNADSRDLLGQVFSHEITHRLKEASSADYLAFAQLAEEQLRRTGEYDSLASRIRDAYGELSPDALADEMVAHYAQKLVTSIDEFERLAGINRNLAQKLLDWLDEILHQTQLSLQGLTVDEQNEIFRRYTFNEVAAAAKAWKEALRRADAGAKGQGDVRRSVMFDADQKPYVVVDADILRGVPKSQWVKTVKNTFKRMYPDGIDMGFFRVKQNADSRNEYTGSRYTENLRKYDKATYAQKMRMANNLGEIVQNAYGTRNEGLKHPRNDNYQSFNHGTIDVKIGNQDYSVEVVTAINRQNDEVFYDIVKIVPTKITEATQQDQLLITSATSADPTVPQTEPGVNTSIPGSGVENDMLGEISDLREPDYLSLLNGKGGLLQNEYSKKFNRRTRRALDAAGKKLGVAIVFDAQMDGDGYYDGKNRIIHISMESTDPLNVVMTHEMTHRMKETSPELYQEFSQLAAQAMQNARTYGRVGAAVEMTYGTPDADEVTAHYTRMLVSDISEFEKLVGVNRNLAQKMLDLLDEVFHKLGFDSLGDPQASAEVSQWFGDISRKDLENTRRVWREMLQKADAGAETQDGIRRHVALNAEADIDRVLNGERLRTQVRLRDYTPAALVDRGIPDLPMYMNAAHIRENILNEAEARAKGLPADERIHYHGLGKDLFLQAVDAMDGPIEVFQWRKNPYNHYGPKDYLVITQVTDQNGNRVVVPIVINSTANANNAYIDVNEIKSIYGKDGLEEYLSRYTADKSLSRVKRKKPVPFYDAGENTSGISQGQVSSDPTVPQMEPGVNTSIPGSGAENDMLAGIRDLREPDMLAEADANTAQSVAQADSGWIDGFSEQEAQNLASHKGIVNGRGMGFSEFAQKARALGNGIRFYFGKVSGKLANAISGAVGKDLTGYNIAIRSDEVVHSYRNHGNAATEALRGHLPVNEQTISQLPRVFENPDEVAPLSEKDYAGRTAFEVRKNLDGYVVAVVGVADGRHSIEIDSVRIIKKKGTPTTANSALRAQDHTSETSSGQYLSPDPTLPQQAEGVNTSIPGSGAENDMLAGIRDLREPDMLAEAGNPNGFTGLVSNQNASRVSRRVRRALNAAGKKLGVAVVFDTSLHGDNGSYDPKTKTLRIAMDASDPLRVIFTHEATHRLKETSPELYAQFEEMALDALRESGSYDRVQYAVEKAYGEHAFREEAAAHFTRLLTEDIGEFEKLVGVNRNLAQKLLDLLDEVLHSAGAGWDGLGTASGDQDLLFGNYTPEQLTKLRDAWAEMLQKADAGAQGSGEIRRMFVLASEQEAARGEALEQEGKPREDIWREAGVIRDAKGNWITEIDDSGARFEADPPVSGTLGDYMKHDALYGRYPELKNRPVYLEDMGTVAGKNTKEGLALNYTAGQQEQNQTLLHETQHEVQRSDGRPNGGNPLMALSAEFNRVYEEIKNSAAFRQARTPGERLEIVLDRVRKQHGTNDLEKLSLDLYRNITGEYEAYRTEDRRNMSAAERRAHMPNFDDVIVVPDDVRAQTRKNLQEIGVSLDSLSQLAYNGKKGGEFDENGANRRLAGWTDRAGDTGRGGGIRGNRPQTSSPISTPYTRAAGGAAETDRKQSHVQGFGEWNAPAEAGRGPLRHNLLTEDGRKYSRPLVLETIGEKAKRRGDSPDEYPFKGIAENHSTVWGMNNYSYRCTNEPQVSSSYAGYGMFADDPSEAMMYGKDMYAVRHSDLVDIDDLKPRLIEIWNQAKEDGYIPPEFRVYEDESDEYIGEMFDPLEIVDGAGAWDIPELISWFYEFGAFDDIKGIKTRDGAMLSPSLAWRCSKVVVARENSSLCRERRPHRAAVSL